MSERELQDDLARIIGQMRGARSTLDQLGPEIDHDVLSNLLGAWIESLQAAQATQADD